MTYRTHAITFAKKDIRENSRIYILYSKDVGKIEAIARGSRKILSKLAPHLEPPIFSDIMIARGKRIDKLAGATSFSAYPKIKSDLFKIKIVFSCFQILDSLTRPNQKDTRLWQMLEKFLKICEDADKGVFKERGEVLQNAFFIKLLAVLGFNFVDYIKKGNIEMEAEEVKEIKHLLEKKFEEIINSSFKISDKTKESIALYLEMYVR
ncbi:MAG: DNA repair protein RecO [Patescibacteria group bacterium]|nr:DNA repair protein RecO [Patescibacteria group bacterium]